LPDDYEFSPEKAQSIISAMLSEFRESDDFTDPTDAAEGWRPIIDEAKKNLAINAKDRVLKIPRERSKGPLTPKILREIVVPHEIGVHMMRSLVAEQFDVEPLRTGLPNYGNSEEALGVVFEQMMKGEYETDEKSIEYYLIAGLSYFDGKTPADTFQILSRLKILDGLPEGASNIPLGLKRSMRSETFATNQRIFRGTDELPLFKDLAYSNYVKIW